MLDNAERKKMLHSDSTKRNRFLEMETNKLAKLAR
jgi:hypothetical protein